MDALLSIIHTLRRALDILLPFTDPSTPLIQDIIHTIALCSALYFAPTILERRKERLGVPRNTEAPLQPIDPETETEDAPEDAANALPHLRPQAIVEDGSSEDEFDIEPPPLAPTPPPGVNGVPDLPFHVNDAGAGPANPQNRTQRATQSRVVGAKKAKSLARKDQRRAYHEFVRQQAEQQRAAEADGAEEREEALYEEKRRRAAIEDEIRSRLKEERDSKKEEERKEAEEDRRHREICLSHVKGLLKERGAVDLNDVARRFNVESDYVERLMRVGGVIEGSREVRDGKRTLITGQGWLVEIDAGIMKKAYVRAAEIGMKSEDGRVSMEDIGMSLEQAVREAAEAAG
jgi:hypothetical protein